MIFLENTLHISGCLGCDCTVVGFTTNYAISV